MRSRLLIAAVTIAAVALPAAPAVAASVPRPVAVISAPAPVTVGTPVTVKITGASRYTLVRVTWGDGQSGSFKSRCTIKSARRDPSWCGTTLTHTYLRPGDRQIVVKTKSGRVLATQKVTIADNGSTTPPSPSGDETTEWRKVMLDQINGWRAAAGAPPLAYCRTLENAAQAHADDMVRRNYYGHYSPEGSTPGDRSAAAGYDATSWAENIARGYQTPEDALNGWRTSPPHNTNMMNPNLTHVGFGLAEGANDGDEKWVQTFGRGKNCGG